MRSRTTCAVALALLLLGIALPICYARWLNTRTFVALEMPVSLAPGKLSSPGFKINLGGWYQVGTDLDQTFPYRFDCGLGGQPPLLKTHVVIYEDGRVIEQSGGSDRFLGHFHARPGKQYRFDVDVLTDASCLNTGHPRIFVWTESRAYEYLQDVLWTVSAILFLWGLGVLIFSVAGRAANKREPESQLCLSERISCYYPTRRARPLKPRFARIPSFGLLYATTLAVMLLPTFLIYLYIWGYDHSSEGIRVHLVSPDPLRFAEIRMNDLFLRVECTRPGSLTRLYLNSRPIQSGLLPDVLKNGFKSRAEWVVYVEGDSSCTWQDVANAIDTVRSAGGQLVLLTADESSHAAQVR